MEFNTLALKDDFALTADESQEIDLHIDGIIEKHRQDSQELSRMALESASLITAVEARSNGMISQGFFSRLWNTFTGNNHRLSASNQRDMARAQYLSQQMLNKLFEQNLVQFEMMVNIEHKVSILAQDIIETNQNLLQVCNVLSAFFRKQKKIKAEMAEFRRNDDLLFWKETIRDEEVFQDKPYSQLQKEQRVVCIANAFYTISKGHWNDRDLLFLKSVMREVGLEPDETVVPAHVLKTMSEDDALLQQFCRKTGYDISTLSPELSDTPFSACLAKLEMLKGEENYQIQTVREFTPEAPVSEIRLKMALKYIRQQTGRNLEKSIPCFDMVLDLVSDLSMIPFFIVPAEPAAAEEIEVAEPKILRDIENETNIDNLAQFQEFHQQRQADTITNEQKEDNLKNAEKHASDIFSTLEKQGVSVSQKQRARIVKKMTEILTYEPVVGIFGKTGVGKSSLCNALFGQDVAEISDVGACTRNIQEIALNVDSKGIKLLDVPGVGENRNRDEEYAELYKTLLPELDVVLWLLKGDDRAFSVDEEFYNEIVKPHLHEGKPFLIVLNQVDKIEPFREWDEKKNEPGPKQEKNIKDKVKYVSGCFSLPESRIIPVSANEKYNLPSLVDDIVFELPKDKKISFAKNVKSENVSEAARSSSESGLWESVTDFLDDKVKQPILNAVDKAKDVVSSVASGIWDTLTGNWWW